MKKSLVSILGTSPRYTPSFANMAISQESSGACSDMAWLSPCPAKAMRMRTQLPVVIWMVGMTCPLTR